MARRLAIGLLAAVLATAALADLLASDRPLVLHLDGETYVLPNLIDYPDLAGLDGAGLRAAMDPDDWAVWAPVRHGPSSVRTAGRLALTEPPSAAHWLGTDDRGRDVLARLIHGARTSALVAAGAALLALLAGAALGLLAVWRGGLVDAAVIAACDVVGALPALLVVIAAQGLLGGGGLGAVIALVALPRAADLARLTRGALLAARASDFCAAARALGAGEWRVLTRHALPQAGSALAVATALTAATAVLAEAALGFLGFGAPAPTASWGELLRQAHENDLRLWLALPAGLLVALVAAAAGALAQPRPMVK
jgi:peptide/nickel transport system permease protein